MSDDAEKWAAFIQRIAYKPCVKFDGVRRGYDGAPTLSMIYVSDTDTSGQYKLKEGDTLVMSVLFERELPPFPDSDHYALRIIYDLICEMERHEAAEWLNLDGDALFNPHRAGNAYLR